MSADFHIFSSEDEQVFTVRQAGLYGSLEFSSLSEATRHLRNYTEQIGGFVVIHDAQGDQVNRIPLHLTGLE